MKFSQLFKEDCGVDHLQLEGNSEFQEYKHNLMKKLGYDTWEQASKDPKFMSMLDQGWNSADEAGEDGRSVIGEATSLENEVDELKDMIDSIGDYDYYLAKSLGSDAIYDAYSKSKLNKSDIVNIKKYNKKIKETYIKLNREGKLRGQ